MQLDRLLSQSHLQSRFEYKESLVQEATYESRNPTSFDSFEKLEEFNRVLRNKLSLSKRNMQPERQKEMDHPIINYSTEGCRDGGNTFTVSSIYSKAFLKTRMP